jgi:arylformamidase
MDGRLRDITRPVRVGVPVWPGDPPYAVAWAARIARGDGANVAQLSIGAHTGTHADGPYHVREDGARISAVPLDAFVGPARVIDARGMESIEPDWLIERIAGDPPRILLRTGCWSDPAVFPTRYPALTPPAAELLKGRCILYGTDAPSVDPPDSHDLPAHHVLAAAGVVILENLLLDDVASGEYGLIALPLRLEDADSSPVRAVLVETWR